MAKEKEDFSRGILEFIPASVIGISSIQIVEGSNIPGPIRSGTSSLIGVGLLKGAGKLL